MEEPLDQQSEERLDLEENNEGAAAGGETMAKEDISPKQIALQVRSQRGGAGREKKAKGTGEEDRGWYGGGGGSEKSLKQNAISGYHPLRFANVFPGCAIIFSITLF